MYTDCQVCSVRLLGMRKERRGDSSLEGWLWTCKARFGIPKWQDKALPESPRRVLSSYGSFLASLRSRSLQGPRWRSVEEEFPHIYAHGCVLKDVCSDCTSFVTDVLCSSRKSVDVLNATPKRSRQTQSLYIPNTRTLNFQ